MERKKANDFFSKAQIAGGGCDGIHAWCTGWTEIYGRAFAWTFLVNGSDCANATIPVWMMILCSAVMGIGTSIGGKR